MTQATAGAPRPGTSARGWVRRALVVLLVAAALAVLVRDRDAVSSALRGLAPAAAVLSVVPAVLAMGAALGVWRSVLGALGHPLPVRTAAPIFYASQLGKYLPGAVWSIASQVELTRELRIPRRTVVAVGALTLAVSVAVGLPMAALLLPPFAPEAVRRFRWAFLLVPLLLLVLHPVVLGPLLDGALRLVRRDPLPARPSGAGMARAAAWQVLVWVLLGVHAWVLVVGLGAPAWPGLPVAVGAYALAYPVGLLSLLPGGAGAREAALTLALSTVLPAPAALLFAVLSRATLVLVDLGLAAAVALPRRR